VETKQEPRKMVDLPKGMTPHDEAMARVIANYKKTHPDPEEVIDDYDDPRAFMDSDELKAHYAEKLAKEEGKTQLDRRKEVMERVYAKDAPLPEPEEEENPFDDRPAAHKAVEKFLDANPEYREEAAWKDLRKTAL
jgi:hypothetical protein